MAVLPVHLYIMTYTLGFNSRASHMTFRSILEREKDHALLPRPLAAMRLPLATLSTLPQATST